MNKRLLEKEIKDMDFNPNIIKKLQENGVTYINDLWILKRKDLKDISLTDAEINQIVIKLQLHGLDLNRKKY